MIQDLEVCILLWFQEHVQNDTLTPIVIFITNLAKAGWIWILLSLGLLIPKKTRPVGIMCAISLILMFVLNNLLLKNLVARPRPYDMEPEIIPLVPRLHDFSFPSGHASSSFAVGVVIYNNMSRKIGIPTMIIAILISLSRIYLGVHYPTDVIFAALEGTLLAYFAAFLVKKKKPTSI